MTHPNHIDLNNYRFKDFGFYIYKFTDLIKGKIYYGQTNCVKQRFSQYKSAIKNNFNECYITRGLIKRGLDNFKFEIIAQCKTQEALDETEIYLINRDNCLDPLVGYNVMPGGKTIHTELTRIKISEGLQNFYANNISKRKGIPLTEEHKRNVSIGSMGKKGTNLGKEFSDEHKLKMSLAQKGRVYPSRQKFPEDIQKEICRLYIEENQSSTKLGKKYNCRNGAILNVLKRNNVTIRFFYGSQNFTVKKILSLEEKNKACEMYKNKISLLNIGKFYHVDKGKVKTALLEMGVL